MMSESVLFVGWPWSGNFEASWAISLKSCGVDAWDSSGAGRTAGAFEDGDGVLDGSLGALGGVAAEVTGGELEAR